MRILWLSNAFWAPSGYGEQSKLFIKRLQAAGHDVAMMCNFGIQEARWEIEGIQTYPADGSWGNLALPSYIKDWKADLVIALCDAHVLDVDKWPEDIGAPMAVWAPLDHYPIPPMVLHVLQDKRIRPIAMSRFGEEWMHRFDLNPLYVPHGVDTDLFTPRPEVKRTVRENLGIDPDCFLVGMVAANRGQVIHRKAYPEAFQAFAEFAKRHEDAFLYAHTEARNTTGMNLDVLATAADVPLGRIRFPDDEVWHMGMPNTVLAQIYQAFDVLLQPSMGEGFGIPLVEAQACGIPIITSDHSAMTELGREGWLVDGQPFWDHAGVSWFFMPWVPSIVNALEAAYEERDNQARKDAAIAFAQQYEADKVMDEYWKPALDLLVPPEIESRQVRRARERKEQKAAVA